MTNQPVPLISPRKQVIARHFAQACDYDNHATIQRRLCYQLLQRIYHRQQSSVLEVGAGSGQLTKLLAKNIHSSRWVINELSDQQAAHLQFLVPQATLRIGDAETLDLGDQHSLIVSANAVQWFDKPLSFVTQSTKRLQAGGQLLFNTFTANNFYQIKTLTNQGLHYPDNTDWQEALQLAGLTDIHMQSQRFDVSFCDPMAVLRHMKRTGVTAKPSADDRPFIWSKSSLRQFCDDYQTRFCDGNKNVILTYEALIISAVKP